ncbi:hypothetical protein [Pleionea sp. CnH1-48]|uniref:hypothetical protein n=1 Tax=Pleionea sp. CnH1-48 TaxID=2954494 RepID=UPI002096DC72|nr:hypothetical protein [Pleionea sp. CnH1-48]MCO7227028.1 hypothetical protein [Pleionea sp. CnH1-48]
MITIEDCYGFCDLAEGEISAIAEHENLPDIVAIELAQTLVKKQGGITVIRNMILDDISFAHDYGNTSQEAYFKQVLSHFDKKLANQCP